MEIRIDTHSIYVLERTYDSQLKTYNLLMRVNNLGEHGVFRL